MLSAWFPLLFSAAAQAGQNQTQQRNVEFGIDEVAVLNREFLDYLVGYAAPPAIEWRDLRCVNIMRQLAIAYSNREPHGLEWFDSWGKVPSGLYYGNGYALGNFEQCRKFSWEQVRGQHCTFVAALPNDLPLFYSGLCVPQFCAPEFVQQLYGGYLLSKGVTVLSLFDQNSLCYQDREVEFDGGVIMATIIFSCIAGLVIFSTLYEVVQQYRKQDVVPLYSAFSLLQNLRSILHITPQPTDVSKKMEMIECANGIRALSMIWIIVVHIHESLGLIAIDNDPARASYLSSFGSTVLFITGYLAVDTFLVLSGILVAWNLLKELDKKGKINPLQLYLHRYIRITAPYAAMILFVVSFAKYMGEGPLWKSVIDREDDICSEYWWSALLHVQNYVNPTNMCLSWTWYLSVDMQLYILAPALIYPLWRYGKRVIIGIAFLAVLSMACVFTTFLVNGFRISMFAPAGFKYILTYFPTHARMAVWLLGIIFGYILYSTKTTGIHLPKRYYGLGWSICFTLLGLILYANYEFVRTDYQEFSNVADAFYEALHRSVFAICLMWIIFACVNRKAGVINEFLSAGLWKPVAKLSFTMYLLHVLMLLMARVASYKTDTHFSVMDVFYQIWGAIGLTTSVSLLWSAIFEVPFVTLDKLLLRR